jgi:putative component of toxin-antitoxin plasmid stabilization module
MKKILVTLAFGCLSIAGFSNSGNREFAYDSLRKIEAKYMNFKALKDFKTRFGTDGTWFTAQYGIVSYFTQDGYTNRVYYDKKGHWVYSLLTYGENKLDRDVRKAVKMNFYDLNITLVKELQTLSGLVYIITLEDKTSIKLLKINREGEMEIMQEMTKQ